MGNPKIMVLRLQNIHLRLQDAKIDKNPDLIISENQVAQRHIDNEESKNNGSQTSESTLDVPECKN